jgi:hypothetical protein
VIDFSKTGDAERAAGLVGWPQGTLICVQTQNLALPGLALGGTREVFDRACRAWREVCGVKLHLAPEGSSPQIVPGVGRIDGAYGTLAWSEMPYRGIHAGSTPLRQLYDRNEDWVRLGFVTVLHELGHAIGMPHIDGEAAIMNRTVGQISALTPADVRVARQLYGQAVPEPAPVPVPVPVPKPDPQPTPGPDLPKVQVLGTVVVTLVDGKLLFTQVG